MPGDLATRKGRGNQQQPLLLMLFVVVRTFCRSLKSAAVVRDLCAESVTAEDRSLWIGTPRGPYSLSPFRQKIAL